MLVNLFRWFHRLFLYYIANTSKKFEAQVPVYMLYYFMILLGFLWGEVVLLVLPFLSEICSLYIRTCWRKYISITRAKCEKSTTNSITPSSHHLQYLSPFLLYEVTSLLCESAGVRLDGSGLEGLSMVSAPR